MITAGVALGAIQVPAGGQPVVVFVEQQTTGGYPIIGNVIAADLASVGQLRPARLGRVRAGLAGSSTRLVAGTGNELGFRPTAAVLIASASTR